MCQENPSISLDVDSSDPSWPPGWMYSSPLKKATYVFRIEEAPEGG